MLDDKLMARHARLTSKLDKNALRDSALRAICQLNKCVAIRIEILTH